MSTKLIELVIVFFIFVYCSKPFCYSIIYLVQESKLFEMFRAYIEIKYSKTKIEYLINCPFCMSYWICLLMSIMFLLLSLMIGIGIQVAIVLSILLWVTCTGVVVRDLKDK